MSGKLGSSDISLYFHIPFCTRKCDYCHFYVLPDKEVDKDKLLRGFHQEWALRLPQIKGKRVVSVYFGGGTPFLFGPERVEEVMNLIRDSGSLEADAEITLEANPENITLPLMRQYASSGINRVSIGVQSFDNTLLKTLGRLHSANKAVKSIFITAEAGFHHISVDLMYDLPNQTLDDWKSTLEEVGQLPIDHLSLYNLTIEPHTVFFKNRSTIKKLLPDEETSLAMYEAAIEELGIHGLRQYEISAFAKNNNYARHNVGYWLGRPFLGFGPSAFSYWEGRRFQNVANLNRYSNALEENLFPVDFDECLSPSAHLRELFVIQLRLIAGVDLKNFQIKNGKLDSETLTTLEKLSSEGFLDIHSNLVKLTHRGILFYDQIASELI